MLIVVVSRTVAIRKENQTSYVTANLANFAQTFYLSFPFAIFNDGCHVSKMAELLLSQIGVTVVIYLRYLTMHWDVF